MTIPVNVERPSDIPYGANLKMLVLTRPDMALLMVYVFMADFGKCNINPQNPNPRSDNQLCVRIPLGEYFQIVGITCLETQIRIRENRIVRSVSVSSKNVVPVKKLHNALFYIISLSVFRFVLSFLVH